jgi:hypothetical protein
MLQKAVEAALGTKNHSTNPTGNKTADFNETAISTKTAIRCKKTAIAEGLQRTAMHHHEPREQAQWLNQINSKNDCRMMIE